MPIEKYGLRVPDAASPADIELLAFAHRRSPPSGLGRYQHLRNAVDLLHNEPLRKYAQQTNRPYDERKDDAFIWNDWSELMMETFCTHKRIAITGPNASWKTTCAAMYGHKFWLSSPDNTIVVMTSTSIPGLKKRIWKEMVRFHRATPVGNVVSSDVCIRYLRGSDEAGIFGIATGQDGDIEKAVNKIIGFHATNVLAICDEAHATNEALIKACRSLEAGADNFQLIVLGNAASELDPHGQMCEPKEGWESITPESETWETRSGGICIHLDGLECPRVKEGDEFYPGMLTKENISSMIEQSGEDSPEFWQSRRGFWAPQGVTKTILTPTIINRFHARDKAIWQGEFKKGASLDPSFEGGDRCVLRFSKCGQIDTGQTVIALGKPIIIKSEASSSEPIHYQIVRQVKERCEEEGVTPEWFALDSTGEGGGLASIFRREWSDQIMEVEFGGRPSDDPISENNPRPAREEYVNKVTELWYSFRVLVQNDQIRELDIETGIEFCQRLYKMQGNLRVVESKTDMKKRSNRSPDLGDNAVIAAALFREKVRMLSGQSTVRRTTAWSKVVKKHNEVYDHSYLPNEPAVF